MPRGANYIRLGWQRESGRLTFYPSTFNTDTYDPDLAAAVLADLHNLGYNVVRVFLNPCCDTGLSDPSGVLSLAYLDNIVDFLNKAASNGIYVMFAGDAAPRGIYRELRNPGRTADFAGYNFEQLFPSGVQANLAFYRDFAQALIDRGAPLEAIFAYGLRNELFFESNLPPLSLAAGVLRTANGKSYDMASPEDKRRMLDEGLVYFIDKGRAAILEVDPTALVTVGFFWPQEPNPARAGDTRFIETRPAIWDSQADFVDLHLYPGVELSVDEYVEHHKIDGMAAKPIIMGEFGAFTSSYYQIEDAALAMQDLVIASCDYGFDGWLFWTWDTEETPELYNGASGNGLIGRILAPTNRPDPCKPATDIEVSVGEPGADGSRLASGKIIDVRGNPIPDAALSYQLVPIDGQGVVSTSSHEGSVPAGATHATLGFRVNTECGCSGEAYRVAFSARVAPASAGSGYFTLVFLGPSQEVARIRLPLEAGSAAEGILTSDPSGRFEIPLGDIPGTTLRLVVRVPAVGGVLPGSRAFEIPAH